MEANLKGKLGPSNPLTYVPRYMIESNNESQGVIFENVGRVRECDRLENPQLCCGPKKRGSAGERKRWRHIRFAGRE